MILTEAQIKYMTNRFLGWSIPKDFNPDAYIDFKPSEHQKSGVHPWPVGTNLLDAVQAKALVRYLVEGLPPATMRDPNRIEPG